MTTTVKSHTRNINGKLVNVKQHTRELEETNQSMIDKLANRFPNSIDIRPSGKDRRTTDNEGVAFAFSKREGNVKNANDSFAISQNGRVAYSYATPIAYRSRDTSVYINNDKYSPTTTTQRNKLIEEVKSEGQEPILTSGKGLVNKAKMENVTLSTGRINIE